MKMPLSFLICSGFFFLGGLLLFLFGQDLGLVLVLMGGIPLLIVWCGDLFRFLPEALKVSESTDTPKKEDTKE